MFVQIGSSAVGPLLEELPRLPAGTFGSVADALTEIGDQAAVEPLIEIVERELEITTPYPELREQAVKALGTFRDKKATPVVIQVLEKGQHSDDGSAAAFALAEIDDLSAVDALWAVVKASTGSFWSRPDSDRFVGSGTR